MQLSIKAFLILAIFAALGLQASRAGAQVDPSSLADTPENRAALQVEIAKLQIQIQELLAQLTIQSQSVPPAPIFPGATVGWLPAASQVSEKVFTYRMLRGSTDADTHGEVSTLQKFLAKEKSIYPEGLATGYFGVATEKAVQRFQSKNKIVVSGTPTTTGFGAVGPKTLAILNASFVSARAPKIISLAPTSGFFDQTVNVVGERFSTTTGNNTVYFGASAVPKLSSRDGRNLQFKVPVADQGAYPVAVANEFGRSNEANFIIGAAGLRFKVLPLTDIIISRPKTGIASASNTITLDRIDGTDLTYAAAISVSGMPYQATAASMAPCVPPCSRANIINIGPDTPESVSKITVTAKTKEYGSTNTFNLIILPYVPFGFQLSNGGDVAVTKSTTKNVTSSVTVFATPSRGINQNVSFAAAGVTPGVAFGGFRACKPPCAASSTITVYPSATAGTSTITITGTGGEYNTSTTFSIAVSQPPPFQLEVTSISDIVVDRPASGFVLGTNTVGTALLGGDPKMVTFTQTGLPSGTTAGFLASCLPPCERVNTLTVRASTPAGVYPITLTASGAGASSSAIYNLTVNDFVPMSFGLFGLGDIVITKPVTGTAFSSNTIFVQYHGGVLSPVSFSQTGLPTGAGAAFISPCTPDCTLTNTVTINASTPVGDYIINFSGVGGGASSSVSYILRVQ